MSEIITNANAPQVKITIECDFRYNPARRIVNCSQTLPALVVQHLLMLCALDLNGMMQQAESQKSNQAPVQLPDLPPAPKTN